MPNKLQKTIDEAISLFEHRKVGKDDTERTIISFTHKAWEERTALYEALSDALFDMQTDEDSKYYWTLEYLELLSDQLSDVKDPTEEELSDCAHVFDEDVEIYTANLTRWLASNLDNVSWLEEALSEGSAKTAPNLLMLAQSYARNSVATAINEALTSV